MSQIMVIGGIFIAFVVLWLATRSISRQSHKKHSIQVERENSELRHVVMEMAKEKHHHSRDEHRY